MDRFLNNNENGIEIGRILSERGLTMATAESCTGGTIASMVTAVAGSSSYFKGGVVSYAVSVKEQVLGVALHDGVVSEDTALQMAKGAAQVCGADCAVATTGVAGPGPSEGKPQGTVCIAAVWKRNLNSNLNLNPNLNPNPNINPNPNPNRACGLRKTNNASLSNANANENLSSEWTCEARTFAFEGDREAVILQAADAALALLKGLLLFEK